jgi:hypothetical protein
MGKGINLAKTEDYICSIDADDPKTVWKISAVDSIAVSISVGSGRSAEDMTELVRFGLKGFENFPDSEGKPIVFETQPLSVKGELYQVVARKVLKQIPVSYLLELGTRILALSTLSEDQRKN